MQLSDGNLVYHFPPEGYHAGTLPSHKTPNPNPYTPNSKPSALSLSSRHFSVIKWIWTSKLTTPLNHADWYPEDRFSGRLSGAFSRGSPMPPFSDGSHGRDRVSRVSSAAARVARAASETVSDDDAGHGRGTSTTLHANTCDLRAWF